MDTIYKTLAAKDIKGVSGYKINKNGEIFSCLNTSGKMSMSWHKLKPCRDSRGYFTVALRGKTHKVHRLVAETFMPNPKNNPLVCHKNSIQTDNRLENLYWGTYKENIRDSIELGRHRSLHQRGEKSAVAKLTDKKVRVMKWALHYGCPHKYLVEVFKVSLATIGNIKRGANWKHITIS